MLLPFSCNIDSSEALTMLDGMSPAREFAPRFNKASLVRLPIDVGRLPVREFWLRSTYASWVIPYTAEGMLLLMLLVFATSTDNPDSLAMLDGMLPARDLLGRLICVTELPSQVTPTKLHTFPFGTPLVHDHDTMLSAAAISQMALSDSVVGIIEGLAVGTLELGDDDGVATGVVVGFLVGVLVGLLVGTQKVGSTGVRDGLQAEVLF